MNKSLFFISSALNPIQGTSVYSLDERINQTYQTIESIDKYCPNNIKVLFETSIVKPDDSIISTLNSKDVFVIYTGDNKDVIHVTKHGMKSLSELISFIIALRWIKSQYIIADRIYKISGRYRLNENFSPGFEHKGKYVFTHPVKTWMSDQRIQETGVDSVYQTRLYHFDIELLDQFMKELSNTLVDCIKMNIDIEHSFYKQFKKYCPIEKDKIGVCGNLSPNGEYIDE